MHEREAKCMWIGIGSDVGESAKLFAVITKINKLLTAKYNGVLMFSKTNRPHLNIFDLDVPTKVIPQVTLGLQKLLKSQSSLRVKITDLAYFPFGVFYLRLENSLELNFLHKSIVREVASYKGPCICEDYLKPWRKYTKEQEKMLETYGNPFVLDQFLPHITLGFVKDRSDQLEKIRSELLGHVETQEFVIENIQVVHGEEKAHQVIQEYRLK